jgi:ssRNA-specific RNase YbeY (16S rRNA maturation enzyme)
MTIIIKSTVQRLLKEIINRRIIRKEIKQILNYTEYSRWDLGVFFVGDEIKELNLRYRNINKVTDILSFPFHQVKKKKKKKKKIIFFKNLKIKSLFFFFIYINNRRLYQVNYQLR